MVKHVVFFKLKDRSESSILKLRDVLLDMKGKVPSLLSLEVGVDFTRSPRSYDVVLISQHESRKQLDEYQNDPVHMEVKKYVATVGESTVAVDFEM